MADITLRLLTVSFVDGSTFTSTVDKRYHSNSYQQRSGKSIFDRIVENWLT